MSMMLSSLMAAVGSAAFAVLFSVPSRQYLLCGLTGGLGWLLYSALARHGLFATGAAFIASLLVVLLSRWMAVRRQCPAAVLMIPGLFPLIPGVGVYWTVYYLVTNDLAQALQSGFSAIKSAIAIVLGIAVAFEFPQRIFRRRNGDARSS